MELGGLRFLVTGGAGFIGSNLAHHLVRAGAQVTVLDDFSTGLMSNLEGITDKIHLIRGDLRDVEAVKAAVSGQDYILHQAAVASVPLSIQHPIDSTAVNFTGTLNLLEAGRQAGVKRIVMASSASVYGQVDGVAPISESMPLNPGSPYAASKAAIELLGQSYAESYGLETVALRYFNIFGPRQVPTSPYSGVISIFMERLSQGKSLHIHGDGLQSRDFVYIDDVVQINLQACFAKRRELRAYNIGRGYAVSLLQLIDQLGKILGITPQFEFGAARAGDIKFSCADISMAKVHLNFKPSVSLADGLERTCHYFGLKKSSS